MDIRHRIVINRTHGGYGLSDKAIQRYQELGGVVTQGDQYGRSISRRDPLLIRVVEELGDEASKNAGYTQLKIATFSSEFETYSVAEHDGFESVDLSANFHPDGSRQNDEYLTIEIQEQTALVLSRLKKTNIENLTLLQCKAFLKELQRNLL